MTTNSPNSTFGKCSGIAVQTSVTMLPKSPKSIDLSTTCPKWACSLVNTQPYQGKKKGADSGIDGLIFFQDNLNSAKKIIVSVKGGEGVGVSQIRDLKGTVNR